MGRFQLLIICAACLFAPAVGAQQEVSIRFAGAVNGEPFECGRTYSAVGAGRSAMSPQDFRFYVHNVRLVDQSGAEHLIELDQETKWQIERIVLLDFENKTGGCSNGTAETNFVVRGSVAGAGPWTGLRFTLGVPFNRNHTNLSRMPSPLNLTALAWTWNTGRRFARLDVTSPDGAQDFAVHLGSIGCMPDDTVNTIPASCAAPNRVEVDLPGFDPAKNVVVADLGRLLEGTHIERNAEETPNGCRSDPEDADCAAIFAAFGLPFGDQAVGPQRFFRVAGAE